MKFELWLTDANNGKHCKRALIGCISVAVVLALLWGGKGAIASTKAAASLDAAKAKENAVISLRQTIADVSKNPVQKGPAGLSGVQTFLADAHKAATLHSCEFLDSNSGADALPYLSHYKKTPSSDGWNEIGVHINLAGSTRNVLATLKEFQTFGIPFEFNSIDFNRLAADAAGNATVCAKVEIKVLTPAQGA
jgi:hypothetical protein